MINLNNTYWDSLVGQYISELRVDARWILRENGTDKPYGSLRIVSHPDLPPGYLRSFFTYITKVKPKTQIEKVKTAYDYQINISELEVFSIDENVYTETKQYEAPYQELNEMFGVKIFN